ncbi:mitotic centromere-SPB clustering protein Csi1 [Schizosaccharomyces osmophilus]|uniref:Mitotic centromere-SPB clustering protein Csi1 n=1 Tax=Schizosaccharomyces osmophilus TaxID=2545709 RepID=A0AAE9WB44_9SCHI|nr:mitotic centromere-SPB clustering protein Csi1 [Schizosaccharomyces osmophilus]WBW72930.1 mitotic centromere-SPB clustering protein Csi1 [Schizosaccharomyces osmophilus]
MNPGNPTSGLWRKFKQFWLNAKNEYLEWERQQLNEPSTNLRETQDRNSITKKPDVQFIPPPNPSSKKRKKRHVSEDSPRKTLARGHTPKQQTSNKIDVKSEPTSPNKRIHLDLNNDDSFDAPFLTPMNDLSPSRSRFHPHRQPLPSSSLHASGFSIQPRIPSLSSPSQFHFHDPPTQTDPPFPTSSPKTATHTNSESLVLFQRLESIESMLHNLQDKLNNYERNTSASPLLFGPPNGRSSPSLPNFPSHSTPLPSALSQQQDSNLQRNFLNFSSGRNEISGSVEENREVKKNGKELYELSSESSSESEDSLILEEFSESRAFNSPKATQDNNLQTLDAKKGTGNNVSYNISASSTLGNQNEPSNQNMFDTSTPISNRTAASADKHTEMKKETPDLSNNKDTILAGGNTEMAQHEPLKEQPAGSSYIDTKNDSADHRQKNNKSVPTTGISNERPDISTTMFEQLTPIPKTSWSRYSQKREVPNTVVEHPRKSPSINSQTQSPRQGQESTSNDIEHTKEALARLRSKMQERLKRRNSERKNQTQESHRGR